MEGRSKYLQIHPGDNIMVALQDLAKGSTIKVNGHTFELTDPIAAKHKFSLQPLDPGDNIYMYGVLVGKANHSIARGAALTVKNIQHASGDFTLGQRRLN